MPLRVPKPLSGYELKLEVAAKVVAWQLYGTDQAEATGFLDITEQQFELAQRVAEQVLAALDEFKEE